MKSFRIFASNVPGLPDPAIAIAACRYGASGVLNLEAAGSLAVAQAAIARLEKFTTGNAAVALDAFAEITPDAIAGLSSAVRTVIFTGARSPRLASLVETARGPKPDARTVYLEVTSSEEAQIGAELGVDGFIAKGQEAGGFVGEETSFVLLQRLLQESTLPIWVRGGIGMHSAAACAVAGAAGVWLDAQLMLAAEATLPGKLRAAVERFEGDETVCVGRELDALFRLYQRPGMTGAAEIQKHEHALLAESGDVNGHWRQALIARIGWRAPETDLWPLGQDTVFASSLAKRFRTVPGILEAIEASVAEHVSEARKSLPLQPGSALAQAHGTEYPILQGPMTRVSDTAEFCVGVAGSGALPFLALALLRAPQVRALLTKTKQLAGNKSWGVGILGFVPPELRAEQLEVVREFKPPYAIIAGGRPDQAASLEAIGIHTYLHVPAPSLLRMFVDDGARKFIFEGRECGGHVGPRTSFVLWEAMIDALLEKIASGVKAEELHIIFAGGIHDARSAAMVSGMAAPLAAKGVRIGVLLGTAYLFTEEATRGGAIVEGFQQEALNCKHTVILESGPGHASRCVDTDFYGVFRETKRKLIAEGKSTQEIRDALEDLNLGRLRIASKGIVREETPESGVRYVTVSAEQQKLDGMYMIGQVAALRHRVCTARELHEDVSRGSAAILLAAAVPVETLAEETAEPPCDVAIVGMSCLLPKATDVREFWANVLDKVNGIVEVPKHRFDADLFFDTDKKARDKIYSRWGGFLEDVAFDPMKFGIPPNALPSIDPMQLLSLAAVDEALRDAGYATRAFPRAKTSVLFGLSGGLGDLGINYAVRSTLPEYIKDVPEEILSHLPEWTEDSFAGILLNVAAGRVANRFDLGGVNFTVDAACASSLAAAYLATRELTSGASDMVIVGGVDTVQSPFGFMCFSKAQALSPRGQCRPFDESADGIAISEGITILIFKRLADAERSGDRIYAVIKGIAGSSDGRGRSMTAPRPEGQMQVLRRAYRQAHIRPSTVGYFEAHGTGTVAGDAAELASLSQVLLADGATPRSCAVGSVKSMVGHTKSAAGVTGLMKIALALYHRTLPPTLHVVKPNRQLSEASSPLYANVESRPWVGRVDETPRRAGVSSFGFGGTNFHAVLEEYTGDFRAALDRAPAERWPAELFLWTGSGAQIGAVLKPLIAALAGGATPKLRDLASSICARAKSSASGLRLAIVATSLADVVTKLETVQQAFAAGKETLEDATGIYLAPAAPAKKIAFLFPGQGSQFPGMLRDLALYFPEFRESLEQADKVLDGRLPQPLSSYIEPTPAFTAEEEKRQMEAITATAVAQPALGAVEIALHQLLTRLGITPAMTAGHSYGEYAALAAAGVMDPSALFSLSQARGRAIEESTRGGDAGTMAAVQANEAATADALAGVDGITIANLNAPRQTIISGAKGAIAKALEVLSAQGVAAKAIPVACAFHSPLMQPAKDRLGAALSRQKFAQPAVPVFSNTLAAAYPEDPGAIANLLGEHLVRPVRFVEQIRAMYDAGARVFLEVGPKTVLSGLAKQNLEKGSALILPIDAARGTGLVQFLKVLAQLTTVAGVTLETEELFRGREAERIEVEKLAAAVVSAQGWLVNGSRAFPRSRPTPLKVPIQLVNAATLPEPKVIVKEVIVPAAAPRTAVAAASASGSSEAVMQQFQNMMTQFLQTQASIMTAYLQDGSVAAPSVSMPVAVPVAITPRLPAAPSVEATKPAPVVAKRAAKLVAKPASRNIAAELIAIVSERTGYTADLLDPNANIEADLGIDSIKRVEILSAFQRTCTAAEQSQVQSIMEKLTGARTLGEISAQLQRLFATVAASIAVAIPAPQPVSAARNIASEITGIVSERTGYPADLLDSNAGIEADLGIDSIKRVEILSAFQRTCTAAEQSKVQSIMENLTAARTLGEISAQLQTLFSAAAPVTVANATARDIKTELVAIVSERTGYPADLLDSNAGIEADLGIDSIKRVEILSAFQRTCSAAEQAQVQAIMEKLTGARTLGEMANQLQPVFAVLGPVQTQPVLVAAKPAREISAELIAIVSERTGYPADLLDLNAGIEADLGIDSIKRVEILSAFQRTCSAAEQSQVQGVMEKLTGARTLAEMASRLAPIFHEGGKPATEEVPRFTLKTIARLRQGASQHFANRVTLITDDENGVAAGVAETLNRNGERALLLRHSYGPMLSTEGVFTTDLTDAAAVQAVVESIRQNHGPVGAVIHLLPLQNGKSLFTTSLDEWRAHVRQDVRSLYLLARAAESDLKQTGEKGGALFAVVTGRGGDFGLSRSPALSPTQQAAADFVKTLALEFGGVLCKVVDIDPSDPVAILRQKLIDELTSRDETLQVGLPGDRRLTVIPQLAPAPATVLRTIDRSWVMLLTGGARGITAEIARMLAGRYQPTLILAGTSPLAAVREPADTHGITDPTLLKTALAARLRAAGGAVKPAAVGAAYARLLKNREIHQTLDDLRELGARVEYHAVDVRDEAAFGGLIDNIYGQHGRIDAVIHGAGVIEDKLIKDKTPESFDRVVHTKTDSTYLLARKLRPETLQCFVLMSSITAALGNRAQADYAAANGTMNGVATLLAAQWPGCVVAMNWGPWDQAGMVSDEVRQQFLTHGVQMIPPQGGAEAVLREMTCAHAGEASEPIVVFGDGPWRKIAAPAGNAPATLSKAVGHSA